MEGRMSSFVVQNQVDILPLQDVKTLDKNLSLQKLQMKWLLIRQAASELCFSCWSEQGCIQYNRSVL